MSIKGTPVTSGQSSPASLAEDARDGGTGYGYLYRKDPSKTPDHPDYQGETPDPVHPSAERGKQQRQERIAAFTAILREIAPHAKPGEYPLAALIEAGRRVGVGEATAKDYDRELRRESRDD